MAKITDGQMLELPHEVLLQHGTSERTRGEWWYLVSQDVYGPWPHSYDERTYCSADTIEECEEWLESNGYKSKYGEHSGNFIYVRQDASTYLDRLDTKDRIHALKVAAEAALATVPEGTPKENWLPYVEAALTYWQAKGDAEQTAKYEAEREKLTEISVSYNRNGHHEATASNSAGEWVCCTGLATSGEAFFESNCEDSPRYADLRSAALTETVSKWDYNGSQWSKPVDRPDEEPDESGPWAVYRTEFHGGRLIGHFSSEEAADAWIEYLNAGTDCVCGCYISQEVEN